MIFLKFNGQKSRPSHYSALAFATLISLNAQASWTSPDSYKNPALSVTLGTSVYDVSGEDDSAAFQQAIDDVNSAGGGIVTVPAGTYQVREIEFKSDVHLVFDTDASIYPYAPDTSKRVNLFNMGRSGAIENVSMTSTNGRAQINFPYNSDGLRFVQLEDVTNFKLSKFNIRDTRSTFSSIILTWQGYTDGRMQAPTDGTIEAITHMDAHYGYGLIQAHAAKNVTFDKLKAVGGVTVRLETGLTNMNLAAYDLEFGQIGLHDIKVSNITNQNGQGAVMFQPHTLNHGAIEVTNVVADGSEFGVSIKAGFVATKYTKDPESKNYNPNLTPGSWSSIHVDGVTATYRDNAIVTRYVHLDHYPEELHGAISKVESDEWPNEPEYRGPSIAAVFNGEIDNPLITIDNVNAIGYEYHPDIMNEHDLYEGSVKAITDQEAQPYTYTPSWQPAL